MMQTWERLYFLAGQFDSWLEPLAGRIKEMHVCMYVCMYVRTNCTYIIKYHYRTTNTRIHGLFKRVECTYLRTIY